MKIKRILNLPHDDYLTFWGLVQFWKKIKRFYIYSYFLKHTERVYTYLNDLKYDIFYGIHRLGMNQCR